jgi:imidazolonepropionase-like amidohydrolase/Tol biopolymer transport system component
MRGRIRTPFVLPLVSVVLAGGSLLAATPAAAQAPAAEPPSRTISFTTDECTYCAFDLSPDGHWIIFDLLGQLWRIPAEGGEAVPLTDAVADQAEDLDPVVSPDGRWIVFQSDRPGGRGLWLMPADGGSPRQLSHTDTPRHSYVTPSWSPDGTALSFFRAGRLLIHHPAYDTTTAVELREPPAGRLQHAAWLADGRILLHFFQAPEWVRRTGIPDGVLWAVDPATGEGEEVRGAGSPLRAPVPSPDGRRIAYFAPDEDGQAQLWAWDLGPGPARQLTRQADVLPFRARWTPDGREVVYSAAGRLWSVGAASDTARPIPFTARLRFDRAEPPLPALRFPGPGDEVRARGHMGFDLSAEGDRVAMIALGRLWVWAIGGEPEPVTRVPPTAEWPSWSPDGSSVAWSAGRAGAEDLYITDLGTGQTRQRTRLAGRAERPVYSPDGERIAFFYRPGMADPDLTDVTDLSGRYAVIPASGELVTDASQVHVTATGEAVSGWGLRLSGWYDEGQERPTWSPDGAALLAPAGTFGPLIVPLHDDPVPLQLHGHPTFLNWAADSSVVYVEGNQLWRGFLPGEGAREPVLLAEKAALYPRVARDGTILYMRPDGYRLRRPDGGTEALGWPLRYRVPDAPPVLVRGATLIDGTGAHPRGPVDILIEDGRIRRIESPGRIRPGQGMEVIAGEGRFVVPGLIDLHQHGWDEDDLVYAGSLYHGVTTIREMGGPIARNAAVGEAAEAGAQPGPRVILGGFQLYPGAETGVTTAGYQRLRDDEEGLRAVELAAAFGASYIKMRLPHSGPAAANLVRLARGRGLRIGGHCAHHLPLIAAGIEQVEHLTACDARSGVRPRQDLLQLYREAGVRLVPTVVVASGRTRIRTGGAALRDDPGIRSFIPPLSQRVWARAADTDVTAENLRYLEDLQGLVRAFHAGGVPVATGTDVPFLPGALHFELEELVASGLTPLEAITAATYTAARVLGAEEEIGSIKVGKWADLLLLDADPFEDIRNTRRIRKVIQSGRVVDREALLKWARTSPTNSLKLKGRIP